MRWLDEVSRWSIDARKQTRTYLTHSNAWPEGSRGLGLDKGSHHRGIPRLPREAIKCLTNGQERRAIKGSGLLPSSPRKYACARKKKEDSDAGEDVEDVEDAEEEEEEEQGEEQAMS
ncbi:hypothetical protein QLX08_006254 [Tetragonisca angustula]|uniref:Uncharacterized protein n=1 Tax=Tetragonisca angustula TaxID=166442 RepID=A0AAW0ZWY0_9HYME